MYKWLAAQMNLPSEITHVSMFNRDQCKEAIKILRPKYIQLFGHDLSLKVIVEGPQIEPLGMIIPQEELTEILRDSVPDRQFIFNKNNVICKEIAKTLEKYSIPFIELDDEVVAENLIQYLKNKVSYNLYEIYKYSKDIKIIEMELSSIKEEYSTKIILN